MCGFPRNYAAVWHFGILAAPRRIQKTNQFIELRTNKQRVRVALIMIAFIFTPGEAM